MFSELAGQRRFPYRSSDGIVSDHLGRFPVQTLTEIVAAVVVHSSAVAYSHFGVTLDTQQVKEPVPAERTVARTTAPSRPSMTSKTVLKPIGKAPVSERAADCPDARAQVVKA
jgi:hypothetical protein